MTKTVKRKVGRPKNVLSPKEMLKLAMPVDDIFDKDELDMYSKLVDIYIKDFDDDLSSGDMDDIMDLAKNRVLEFRLLKDSKSKVDRQLDVANAIDKLSKDNKKLKENLFTRRKDRVKPDDMKGFSIVDLVAEYDNDKKQKMLAKVKKMREEEKVITEKRKNYHGNRYDMDDASRE